MAATSKDTVSPIAVKIEGQGLDPQLGARLLEVKVRNSLVAPDVAQVRIADPKGEFVKSSSYKLGAKVEVLSGGPDDPSPVTIFKGMIATLEPEFADGVVACFRAYDRSLALTRGRQTRIFTDVLTTDAIEKVLSANGFSPDVKKDTTKHEFLQQTEQSDWDFINALARTLDYVILVDDTKVKVGPASELAKDVPALRYGKGEQGKRLFAFHPTVTAAQVPEKVVVVAHDPISHKQWEATANTFDGKQLVDSKAAKSVQTDAKPIWGKTTFRYSTTARDEAEVQRKAKAAAARLLQTAAEATGIAEGRPDLRAGARIEVEEVGPFSGKYVISETVHTYRGGTGYRTQFTCSGAAGRSVGEMMGASGNGNGTIPFGQQIVLATVTNNQDSKGLGRVKVKFSTIRDEQSPNPEGWWARIASSSTGKNRGLLMMPQPGEEVLVGFEQGDTAKPMVIGSLWHGKAQPGKDLAHEDGSFSLQSDKAVYMKAQKEIEFHTEADWKVTVAKANTKFDTKMNFDDKAGGNRKIETTGNTDIKGTGPITIKSDAKIEIQAPMITLTADAKLAMSAPMVNISGSGMVVIDGGLIKLG